MIVHLVSVGGGRYDLEPLPATESASTPPTGVWGRLLHRTRARWAEAVHHAQRNPDGSAWARWRGRLICHIDGSIEEQRSLWALRDRAAATLAHPPELSRDDASRILRDLLARARSHHGRWLIVDTSFFLASGLLMLVPGPNLIAYYFGFRVIGHYLSWRGARQALDAIAWTFEPRS